MLALFLISALLAAMSDKQVVFPSTAKPVGPYSPGIFAGEFLYVSGQGAQSPSGDLPATFEEQTRQCLENVKSIVEAAGLTMEHIVYSHVYLADMANYDSMNKVWGQYFARGIWGNISYVRRLSLVNAGTPPRGGVPVLF